MARAAAVDTAVLDGRPAWTAPEWDANTTQIASASPAQLIREPFDVTAAPTGRESRIVPGGSRSVALHRCPRIGRLLLHLPREFTALALQMYHPGLRSIEDAQGPGALVATDRAI